MRIPARIPSLFLGSLLLLTAAGPALAVVGTVQGNVVYRGGDRDGQPAQFVQVTLESYKQGYAPKTELTDEEGFFKFTNVEVGVYKLFAFEAGFVSTQYEELKITPNILREFVVQLQPAEKLVEEIRVVAGRDRLETRETSVRSTVDSDTITRIPLRNNRVQDIITLFPSVTRVGDSESDDISVMGGTAAQVGYRLDGVNFTDILSGGPAGGVSSIAIEQFELIRGGFQAEYGQQSTGIANIITKTGSNEVEFQYALLWRDADATGANQDDLSNIQQIWHDLLNLNLFPASQPTYLRGLTNWSEWGGLPSSLDDDNNPTPRRRVQHQFGVGGPVVMDKVFFYTSLDVLQSDTGSPYNAATFQSDVVTYLAKVTWEVNERNRFWMEWNLEHTDSSGFTNPQWTPSVATEDTRGIWTLAAHDRHIFASEGWLNNASLESSFTWGHQYLTFRPSIPDASHQNNVLLPPAGIINLSMEGPTEDTDYTINDVRLNAAFTKPFRKHNLKLGAEYGFQTIQGTQKRFTTFNDFRLAFASAFNPVGDVVGSLGQMIDPGQPQQVDDQAQLAALYVQDLWTVTDKLTIEPGLRVDWQDFVGKVLIAPRLGVSLDPTGNGQTLVQFNYGHFYDNLFLDALLWDLRPEQTVSEVLAGREATQQTVGFDVTSLPDLVRASIDAGDNAQTLARVVPIQTQIYDIDDRLTAPLNEQWNVQLQRRLPQNVVVSLSYTEAERSNAVIATTDTLDDGSGQVGIPKSTVRALYSTGGIEQYKGWTLGVTKSFADGWLLQASYTQQQIKGPIIRAADPLDPLSIETDFGVLGRDRTEVVNISSSIDLPWKLTLSLNFRYQTGLPRTPQAFSFGLANLSNDPSNPVPVTRVNVSRPLGSNSVRLPPDRGLDLTFQRTFKFGLDNSLETRLTIFNITNEFNVTSGIVTFGDLREPNPLAHPPLQPGILPLSVDIPRTVQLEFRLTF